MRAVNRPELSLTEKLLRAREARGLTWSLVARIGYLSLGLVISVRSAASGFDLAMALVLVGIGLCMSIYSLTLVRQQRALRATGVAGLVYDILSVTILVTSWYISVGGSAVPAGFLVKNDNVLIFLAIIVINSLALRPAYPAAATICFTIVFVAFALFTLFDPQLTVTTDNYASYTTVAVNPNFVIWRILTILMVGGFLTWLTRMARKTIRDVVELERANLLMREQQARVISRGKMESLTKLVAGLVHEFHSPLGAILSASTTAERCASRLSEALAQNGSNGPVEKSQLGRTLSALEQSSVAISSGAQRISSLVSSFRDFARLDRAGRDEIDVREHLDRTLAMIRDDLKGGIAVHRDYQDVPKLVCHPQELNQVFLTLLENAFESLSSGGTVRVATRLVNAWVEIEISDTGKGISPEKLHDLFEIAFHPKDNRMSLGLGLPTAKRIIEEHEGTVAVESIPGQGTIFRICLPLHPPVG